MCKRVQVVGWKPAYHRTPKVARELPEERAAAPVDPDGRARYSTSESRQ
ncbi:MAG: hypothetical protein AAF653_21050 [Chloroflexota bacterium]